MRTHHVGEKFETHHPGHKWETEPDNHGKRWEVTDTNTLRSLFLEGAPLPTLCGHLGRTADSVLAKLRDYGMLTYDIVSHTYKYKVTVNSVYAEDDLQFPKPKQPQPKKATTDMTKPLDNLTLIFGCNIKEMSEADLIKAIGKCTSEITTFVSIPANKWTAKRIKELHAAIDAAVAELDTRA